MHEGFVDFRLRPLLSTFRQVELEKVFQNHHLPRTHSQLRIALSFSALFYLLFAVTDVAVLGYGADAFVLFLARTLTAITALAGIALISRWPRSILAPKVAASLAEIVGMSAFLIIVFYRPDELPWHSMSMSIMLMVVYLFIPNSFLNAATIAVTTTVAYCLLALHLATQNTAGMLTMVMLLVLANAFGMFAALRYERLWRHEFESKSILKRRSFRDHLTDCYNRRYMQEHLLVREVERAYRYPSWLTMIMCDIDHFKSINDTHGHVVGDAVLKHFAALLQSTCREKIDSVIRYGGEEFLIILPETDLHGGAGLAERLRLALVESPAYKDETQSVRVTASFGVAAVDFSSVDHGLNPHGLIMNADEMLYRAKRAGRNCVQFARFPEPA